MTDQVARDLIRRGLLPTPPRLIIRKQHGRWRVHCPRCTGETAAAQTHSMALRLGLNHAHIAHSLTKRGTW